MFADTDTIQILGAACADAPFPSAAHRGAILETIGTNKPFFACSCGIDAPVRADVLQSIDDMAAHYRMVDA